MRNMRRFNDYAFGESYTNCLYPGNLVVFMNEVRKYKGLTEEEEIWLFYRVKNGDKKAEDRLVLENLRLVVSIANAYSSIMPIEDLIQEGNIGLVLAVRSFDIERGYRFITYASMMIRKCILKAIDAYPRMIS